MKLSYSGRCSHHQQSSGAARMLSHGNRVLTWRTLTSHINFQHPLSLWPSQHRHLCSPPFHAAFSSSSSRNNPTRSVAAAAAAAGDGVHQSHSNALMDWVISNGGSVTGVAMANLAGCDGGSGWGLTAAQDISQAGTRLIELPRCCHLTYDESSDPRVLSLIQQVPEELWGAKLALQLLVQRVSGPSSPFSTYVSYLPVGVSGIPMFYTREELEAIEYPPVVEQVKKRGRWLHRFSVDVLAKLPGSPDDPFEGHTVDINSLGWALAVVTSRAFRVSGPAAPAALLPLIDMANHSFEPNCEVVPIPGGVAMVAKKQIAAGEPLLLSYGQLSNDFLLMDYGFVIAGNPYDRVALRFDIDLINAAALSGGARDSSGQLLQLNFAHSNWKHEYLRKLGLNSLGKTQNLQVLLGGPNIVEPRLLAAVRGSLATYQSEVENLTLEVLGSWDRPLNKQNETATIRILIGMAMIALQNFSTGLEADLELLGSSSSSGDQPEAAQELSDNMKLAVLFRSQRKKLLLDVIEQLATRLKQVPRIAGLKESPVVAAKKGQKPRPASNKGFGKA